jgi:ATP-binding cassette subfamily F protein 3
LFSGVDLDLRHRERVALLGPNGCGKTTLLRGVAPMDETEARNFLHFFLFAGDAVFVPLRALSYSERQRLQLALLVAARASCFVLDEPANHLDIGSRERLEQALAAFPGTVLAATHDRAFIDRWATAVWAFVKPPGGAPTVRRFVDRSDLARFGPP